MADEKIIETPRSWLILAAVAVASSFSLLTVMAALLPAITVYIEQDTGWTRTVVTGAVAMTVIAGAGLAPYIGAAMDRHGARIVILVGQSIVIIALGFLGLFGDNILVYYVGFFVAGLATSALTPTTYMRVISQWFDGKRGLAMGLSALGSSLAAVAMPVVGAAISEQFGWQTNFVALAIGSLFIAIPVQWFLIHDRPLSARSAAPEQASFLRAILNLWKANPIISRLTQTFFFISLGQTAILFAIAPMMTDRGMTAEQAATVQATAGLATIFGKIIGGFLFDYFRSAKPIIIVLVCAITGTAGFALGAQGPGAYVCALLLGLSAGIENDAPPYLVSRYFDLADFGKIAASITTIAITALAVGPVFGSALRDLTGDYLLTCIMAMLVMSWGGLLTCRLPSFPKEYGTTDIPSLVDPL